MISAFGIDHGEFSKADTKSNPTGGRYATSYLFPGVHGAVAGKKGKKLRSAGRELGGTIGGSVAGSVAGGLAARGLGGGPKAAALGSALGTAGAIGGSAYATHSTHKAGYYKKQPKGAL